MLMTPNCTRLDPLPDLMMCDRLSFCMDNIKGWTIKNKLKLNENKTKAMVLGKPQYCLEFREIPLILQAVGFPLHLR